MPPDRPGRPPGSVPEEPYYFVHGHDPQARTDRRNGARRPDPPTRAESFNFGGGQDPQAPRERTDGGNGERRPASVWEEPYFASTDPQGRTDRGNGPRPPGAGMPQEPYYPVSGQDPRQRPDRANGARRPDPPTRAESFNFGGVQQPRQRPEGRSNGVRRPDPPTRAESFNLGGAQDPRGRSDGRSGNGARRPAPPTQAESFNLGGGRNPRERTDGRGNGARRPALPTQAESYYLGEGQGPRGRTGGERGARRPDPPTRAESYYLGEGQASRGRTGGRHGARRPAPPTQAESFNFGAGQDQRGRAGGRGNGGRRPDPPTRAESYYFADGQGAWPRTGGRSWETGELEIGEYERQAAGIAALISIATDVAAIRSSRSLETISATPGTERKQSRLSILAKLRQDEMTLNSLFLVVSTGLSAGSGFLFWIVTAHLFSVSDVGKGSALISAASQIGQLALVGLNLSMAKYLPNSRNRHALISSGLLMVAACGAVGAAIYMLLIPFIAPGLVFVDKNVVLAVSFALITAAIAVNTLTDVIFIASRKAKYTTLVDGVIGGFGKIVVAAVLTGAGAYGLFLASSMGTILALAASLLLIMTVMHTRLDLKNPLRTLKPLLRFSAANYLGRLFSMIPGFVVPLVLLDRLGPDPAAYFFVVFQLAQIVFAAAFALEQTFLSEGSRADADMRKLRRRSLRLLMMFWIPTAVIMIGAGRWLLLAFGHPYYQFGYPSLVILVLSAGPISLTYWFVTILRLAGKLRAIIVSSATNAIGTVIFVWIGSYHGLAAVAWGWFAGAMLACVVAGLATREKGARRQSPSADPRVVNSASR